MSPLIDCVFLLLIFFLVTTMLKRKEKHIRVELPDSTASVAVDTREEALQFGLDEEGRLLAPAGRQASDGATEWAPMEDLSAWLKKQVELVGPGVLNRPLHINAHRDTPFHRAIEALDICTLQGFTRVSVKTRQPPREGE